MSFSARSPREGAKLAVRRSRGEGFVPVVRRSRFHGPADQLEAFNLRGRGVKAAGLQTNDVGPMTLKGSLRQIVRATGPCLNRGGMTLAQQPRDAGRVRLDACRDRTRRVVPQGNLQEAVMNCVGRQAIRNPALPRECLRSM
jgi:hypothetical protein